MKTPDPMTAELFRNAVSAIGDEIFTDGAPIAYAATICNHTDVGGRVHGSNASDAAT